MDKEYKMQMLQAQKGLESEKQNIFAHIEVMQTILQTRKDSIDGRAFYSGKYADHLKEIGMLDQYGFTTKDSEAIAKQVTRFASRIYKIE